MSNSMVIDLSNYKDRVGSRVAPNRYRVVVEDVEVDQSKAGNPMINLWFRIVGGEFDGQTLVDRLTLTEKALFRVVGFMQALGFPTPKQKLQINPQKFVGQILDVDVEDGEPYNGRVKSEVRGYIRVPKEARNSAPAEEFEEFGSETEASSESTSSAPAEAAPADEIDLNDPDLDL